jgi:hypothetical protein
VVVVMVQLLLPLAHLRRGRRIKEDTKFLGPVREIFFGHPHQFESVKLSSVANISVEIAVDHVVDDACCVAQEENE